MDSKMKFKCPQGDFEVESADENEVVNMARMHGNKHGMSMSDEDIKSKIERED